MTINLNIAFLEDHSKVSFHQKCVLTLPSLSNEIRCGAWAKCTVQNAVENQPIGHVVCQIYQQAEEQTSCAFMDKTVTTGNVNQSSVNAFISEIKSLQEISVGAVELVVMIKTDFLRKKRLKNIKQLTETCKIILQTYSLVADCIVQSLLLSQLGIVSINVKASDCDENSFYCLNNETKVEVIDVRCAEFSNTLDTFYSIGLQNALMELNNLVKRSNSTDLHTCLNALLVGPTGCGKTTLIVHFVKEQKFNYFHVLIKDILGQYPGETESKLCELFDAAQHFVKHFKPKGPTVIHIEDLQLLCPLIKTRSKDCGTTLRICAQLCNLLDKLNNSNTKIICIATTTDSKSLHKSLLSPGRLQQEIEIEALTDTMRKKLFKLMFNMRFPHQKLEQRILDVVVTYTAGYVASDLALLIRSIEQSRLHENLLEMSAVITAALKKLRPTSLRSTDITVVKSDNGFETIGGMEALKTKLRLNILIGLQRADAYKRFGLSPPKGILLYGPPGCAKTTIAKCLATEAKMTFIATSGAEVYSPYIGCAEKFVAKLFDTARKHAPCLLFLDEIDTLIGNRAIGNNSHSTSDMQTRILSTLLIEMDGIVQTSVFANAYILVVAATNRPNMIDDALLRPGRFDQLIHVPAPDFESRHSILELYKCRMPFSKDCDLSDIARRTKHFSGADICNLCNEAAMHSFQRDFNAEEITKDDFENVLKSIKPSLTQSEINSYFEFKNRRLS